MACVSIKTTETSPESITQIAIPGFCGLHGDWDRGIHSCGGGAGEGLTSCLDKAGHSALHCPACAQFSVGPGSGQGIGMALPTG